MTAEESSGAAGSMYGDGSRQLQDDFSTRRLADRLEQVEARSTLTADDRAFIARMPMFLLATANDRGEPICSYKGGRRGFVRVIDDRHLAFPNYDGNGTFRSLGNVLVNPNVSLFFIDFDQQERLLVEATATISRDQESLVHWPGAQLAIHVEVKRAFSACSRYVHRMAFVEESRFIPREGEEPPVPDWKKKAIYKDVLPPRKGVEGAVG
jgi:predicted pyridoxine 5'-phosphate oxidase superfamily flavin-nucleotide-binding protein